MGRLTSITVRSAFGHNHYTPAEFVKLPLTERLRLMLEQKVEFLDENGNRIPSMEAVDQLPRGSAADAGRAK